MGNIGSFPLGFLKTSPVTGDLTIGGESPEPGDAQVIQASVFNVAHRRLEQSENTIQVVGRVSKVKVSTLPSQNYIAHDVRIRYGVDFLINPDTQFVLSNKLSFEQRGIYRVNTTWNPYGNLSLRKTHRIRWKLKPGTGANSVAAFVTQTNTAYSSLYGEPTADGYYTLDIPGELIYGNSRIVASRINSFLSKYQIIGGDVYWVPPLFFYPKEGHIEMHVNRITEDLKLEYVSGDGSPPDSKGLWDFITTENRALTPSARVSYVNLTTYSVPGSTSALAINYSHYVPLVFEVRSLFAPFSMALTLLPNLANQPALITDVALSSMHHATPTLLSGPLTGISQVEILPSAPWNDWNHINGYRDILFTTLSEAASTHGVSQLSIAISNSSDFWNYVPSRDDNLIFTSVYLSSSTTGAGASSATAVVTARSDTTPIPPVQGDVPVVGRTRSSTSNTFTFGQIRQI